MNANKQTNEAQYTLFIDGDKHEGDFDTLSAVMDARGLSLSPTETIAIMRLRPGRRLYLAPFVSIVNESW